MLSNSVAELDSSVAGFAMFFFGLLVRHFSVAEWCHSVADFDSRK